MRGKFLMISAVALLTGTLATVAQQQPQEPRGEESSRSSMPKGQLPGPDETRGQSGMRAPAPGSQSQPQEPRGEESSQSAAPSGQLPPTREQLR